MKRYSLFVVAFFLICLSAPQELISKESDNNDQEQNSMIIEEGGAGPYKAMALGDETLPGFTIYRPQNLDAFGGSRKLPIILWGNGGCMNSTVGAMPFLNEIASHGFMVFGIGPYSSLKDAPDFMARMEAVRKRMESASDPQVE